MSEHALETATKVSEGEVTRVIASLSEAVAEVGSVAELLVGSIGPVLAPSRDREEPRAAQVRELYSSEIATQLAEIQDRVTRVREYLAETRERVEL